MFNSKTGLETAVGAGMFQVPPWYASRTPARLVKVFFYNVLQDTNGRKNQKEKFCNAHALGKLT